MTNILELAQYHILIRFNLALSEIPWNSKCYGYFSTNIMLILLTDIGMAFFPTKHCPMLYFSHILPVIMRLWAAVEIGEPYSILRGFVIRKEGLGREEDLGRRGEWCEILHHTCRVNF